MRTKHQDDRLPPSPTVWAVALLADLAGGIAFYNHYPQHPNIAATLALVCAIAAYLIGQFCRCVRRGNWGQQ